MRQSWIFALVVVVLSVGAGAASAQHGERDRGRVGGPGDRPPGMYGPRFPGSGVQGAFRGSRYHFDRGRWYRDRGGGFALVGPPVGLYVGVLPPYYSTVWIGGVPYFYADGTYFLWRERVRRYEVVDEPREVVTRGEVSAATDDLYVYPREGQSDERQASDRYECHRWASGQTGFDPVQPDRIGARGSFESRRAEYRRAITACLEGRGYTVR